jgi:hypothetical protein
MRPSLITLFTSLVLVSSHRLRHLGLQFRHSSPESSESSGSHKTSESSGSHKTSESSGSLKSSENCENSELGLYKFLLHTAKDDKQTLETDASDKQSEPRKPFKLDDSDNDADSKKSDYDDADSDDADSNDSDDADSNDDDDDLSTHRPSSLQSVASGQSCYFMNPKASDYVIAATVTVGAACCYFFSSDLASEAADIIGDVLESVAGNIRLSAALQLCVRTGADILCKAGSDNACSILY